MSEYEIGKDISNILNRISELEDSISVISKSCDCPEVETRFDGQVEEEKERPLDNQVFASKSYS